MINDIQKIFLKNCLSHRKVCIGKKYGDVFCAEPELECVLNNFLDEHEGADLYELESQMEKEKKVSERNNVRHV